MSTKTHKKKIKKNTKPKINLITWNTTDSDEVERRKLRAESERYTIINQDPSVPYFSDYFVASYQSKKRYHVEIRSLDRLINSCDCHDYKTNRLGTCKHVEAVLLALRKKGIKKFKLASEEGSARVEIFLAPEHELEIGVLWPKNTSPIIQETLQPFFSSNEKLRGNTLIAFNELTASIAAMKAVFQKKIRVSSHLHYYVDYQNHQLHKQCTKEMFYKNMHQDHIQLPLKHPLLPYQQTGMMHLAFMERALLADEMGLGKTVQAIAACALLQQQQGVQRVLVVAPASLKAEWEEQIAKFTDLSSLIIYGTRPKRLAQYQKPAFFTLMNYEQVVSDQSDIQSLLAPDIIILDEAQRIKNWRTKTANAVKELKSRYAFVLTGTPVENRIDDIYSITQFLDPHIFGSLFHFNRDFYQLDHQGRPEGYKNLNTLYHRLRPVMLCRKKSDVEGELPKRSDTNFFVKMMPEQRLRYDDYEGYVARLVQRASQRPLRKEEFEKLQRWLACMRMLCDTPFILDKECRISPKINELELILIDLLENSDTKIIIFSEWERMLQLVKEMAQEHDWQFAWHTGSVMQHKRREEIRQFKNDKNCRIFLSTDSGSVGLNLQVANVVINLDLPWNPAKLEQRIARAWRKHQLRPVQVINLICENSIEHRMLYLLEEKKRMAEGVLTGDESLSSMKMPSGRVALMERIQSLIDVEPQTDEKKLNNEAVPPSRDDSLKQAVLETLGDTLSLLHTYAGNENQKPVVLAVVENLADDVQHQLSSKIKDSVTLETIDQATLTIIQRLAKAGILTLHTPTNVLHDQDTPDQQQQRRKKQLKQSLESLEHAKKKQRMANVLIESDFIEEALPPIHEAFKYSSQAFSILKPLIPKTIEIKTLSKQCEQLSVHLEKSRDAQSLHDEHQKVLMHLIEMQNALE